MEIPENDPLLNRRSEKEEIEKFMNGFKFNMIKKPKEPEMCWKDKRKELPDDEDNLLVMHENSDADFPIIRAYFTDGYFLPLDTTFSFPLLCTHWMRLPKKVGEE